MSVTASTPAVEGVTVEDVRRTLRSHREDILEQLDATDQALAKLDELDAS